MKIIMAAGGTAGHINPALAAAGFIRDFYPDSEFLFIGTAQKMEAKLVPAAGFDFQSIDIAGFSRKLNFAGLKQNISTAIKFVKSSSQTKKIMKSFQPDVVVGFGGYVSGPVVRTAAKMGIPTAIHEQNAYPGVANKALAKVVDAVMLTSEDAAKHMEPKNPVHITGLPVRSEILSANREKARQELGLDERPLILSTGGSLGADAINKAVCGLMVKHHKEAPYYHIHAVGQYGKFVYDDLKAAGVNLKKETHLMVRDYIDDMDRCYAAADLVIGRAGASSLSELQAVGKPAILIPSPNVAENHQYHNAMAMVRRDAAKLIEEKDLTAESLTALVDMLLGDKESLLEIGRNAKEMAVRNASEVIADVIVSLAKGGK